MKLDFLKGKKIIDVKDNDICAFIKLDNEKWYFMSHRLFPDGKYKETEIISMAWVSKE